MRDLFQIQMRKPVRNAMPHAMPQVMQHTGLVLACLGLLIAGGWGCSRVSDPEERMALKYGETAASYEPGMDPEVVKAGFDGMYELHRVGDDGRPLTRYPLWKMSLKAGEEIGFKSSENTEAAIVAVAGDKTHNVPNRAYRWFYKSGVR